MAYEVEPLKHPFWFGLVWYVTGFVTGFMAGLIALSMYIVDQTQ